MINSMAKGKTGEREVVNLLKSLGFDAHRTAQVDGKLSADVCSEALNKLHIEVKKRRDIIIGNGVFRECLAQSIDDCPIGCTPVLLWKRTDPPRVGWMLTYESPWTDGWVTEKPSRLALQQLQLSGRRKEVMT